MIHSDEWLMKAKMCLAHENSHRWIWKYKHFTPPIFCVVFNIFQYFFRNSMFSGTQFFVLQNIKNDFLTESFGFFFLQNKYKWFMSRMAFILMKHSKNKIALPKIWHTIAIRSTLKYVNIWMKFFWKWFKHSDIRIHLVFQKLPNVYMYTERHVTIEIRLLWFSKMIACCSGWQ